MQIVEESNRHKGGSMSERAEIPRSRLSWLLFALLFTAAPAPAQDAAPPAPEPAPPEQQAATEQKEPSDYNKPKRSFLIPAAEIVGFNFTLNRFDKRFLSDHETFNVSWKTVRRNLEGPWVVDADPFSVNQFLHPYHGSIYHTISRSSGLGFWASSVYTFLGSALWEIAGETESPSTNDQIASGIGGTYFGEALFRMASLTLEESNGVPRVWRTMGAAVISPMTSFNRMLFGDRFDAIFPGHEPAYFAKWNLGATVAERRVQGTSRRSRRNEGLLESSFSYGLPGQPDYIYRRPFDYFNFDLAASNSNIFENIFTRGMLVGKSYGSGNTAGVWGLYGSYDFIKPDVFRVSSTALSLGTTGQWRLGGPVTLQGTALAGVGYGAGGTLEGTRADRDYHYGLTPQSLLAARLIFGKVAALDMNARGYRISTVLSTADRGWENVGRADAALTVRLFGPHAVTAKYIVSRRYASYPDLGIRDQRRDTVSVFYTFMRDRNLGAVRTR
jgi:hypothetical protein